MYAFDGSLALKWQFHPNRLLNNFYLPIELTQFPHQSIEPLLLHPNDQLSELFVPLDFQSKGFFQDDLCFLILLR